MAGWVAFGPRPRIDRATVLRSLLWPAAWLLYTLARGALSRWYPYPFIDAATHGCGQVLVNAVLVLAVLAAVAGLYAAGDSRLRRVGPPR